MSNFTKASPEEFKSMSKAEKRAYMEAEAAACESVVNDAINSEQGVEKGDEAEKEVVETFRQRLARLATPSRTVIATVVAAFSAVSTYYWGAVLGNLLLTWVYSMVGTGFLGFCAYVVVLLLWIVASFTAAISAYKFVQGPVVTDAIASVKSWFTAATAPVAETV